ncbi:hypothetical protein MKEN_00159600 [Mycena kentingensis (nom. inval.)]|nr:hypothetical protein MKEN_00159600 [Mycena kentingensis (nom. inval.)]
MKVFSKLVVHPAAAPLPTDENVEWLPLMPPSRPESTFSLESRPSLTATASNVERDPPHPAAAPSSAATSGCLTAYPQALHPSLPAMSPSIPTSTPAGSRKVYTRPGYIPPHEFSAFCTRPFLRDQEEALGVVSDHVAAPVQLREGCFLQLASAENADDRSQEYLIRYSRRVSGPRLLYFSSSVAALGDFIIGWSEGVAAIIQIHPAFDERMLKRFLALLPQDRREKLEWIGPFALVVTVSLCAMAGSLICAQLSEKKGRRPVMRWGGLLLVVGSTIQAASPNLPVFLIGRGIQGFGVGFVSTVVPVYQTEIASAGARGILAGFEALSANLGYSAAAITSALVLVRASSEISWRIPFIVQGILAFVFVIAVVFIPESPRWLVKMGMVIAGFWTFVDLSPSTDPNDQQPHEKTMAVSRGVVHDLRRMKDHGVSEGTNRFWALRTMPRRLRMALLSRSFAQLLGSGAILHFMAERFVEAGWSVNKAMLYTGFAGLFNAFGAIPAIFFIDIVGRRRSLLAGSVMICIACIVGGFVTLFGEEWAPNHLGGAKRLFASFSLFLFAFGCSWGPIPWLMSAELFPLIMRSRGMALSTATDWLVHALMVALARPLWNALEGKYFFLLALIAIISFPVVLWLFVETGGRSLESIGALFDDPQPHGQQVYERAALTQRFGGSALERVLRQRRRTEDAKKWRRRQYQLDAEDAVQDEAEDELTRFYREGTGCYEWYIGYSLLDIRPPSWRRRHEQYLAIAAKANGGDGDPDYPTGYDRLAIDLARQRRPQV